MPDFRALRSRERGHEAVLYAFDLIEHDVDDLRDLPLIERKRRLARLKSHHQCRCADMALVSPRWRKIKSRIADRL
jgi:ATP-dependent DNA ligase